MTDPVSRGLTDLQMVSANKGFAVGNGVIMVTDDGRQWDERYTDGSWFIAVEAVDGDHAWAVAQHEVLATVDGGRHWLPAGEPEGSTLRDVDFVDPSSGWGSDGRHVYRTADGGHRWELADPPCGAERICFSAADEGWAARDRHVFRTTDGGRTWTPTFTLPVPDSDNQFNAKSIDIDALECARRGVVWVSFVGQAAGLQEVPYVVYRGVAAGSWTPVLKSAGGPSDVAAPVGGTYPAPLAVLDRDSTVYTRFMPSTAPSLFVTIAGRGGPEPGGWTAVPDLYSATSLSFVDAETGWVLGPRAGGTGTDVVLVTWDGGRTWQEQLVRTVPPPGT